MSGRCLGPMSLLCPEQPLFWPEAPCQAGPDQGWCLGAIKPHTGKSQVSRVAFSSSPEGQTPQKWQRLQDQAGLPRGHGRPGLWCPRWVGGAQGVAPGGEGLCQAGGGARAAQSGPPASCSVVPFPTKWEAEDTALGVCRHERACVGVSGRVQA